MRGNIGVGLWESLWQACENLLSVDLKYVGHKWNSSMLARILHKTPLNMMNYKTAALPSGLIHWISCPESWVVLDNCCIQYKLDRSFGKQKF